MIFTTGSTLLNKNNEISITRSNKCFYNQHLTFSKNQIKKLALLNVSKN